MEFRLLIIFIIFLSKRRQQNSFVNGNYEILVLDSTIRGMILFAKSLQEENKGTNLAPKNTQSHTPEEEEEKKR